MKSRVKESLSTKFPKLMKCNKSDYYIIAISEQYQEEIGSYVIKGFIIKDDKIGILNQPCSEFELGAFDDFHGEITLIND